MKICSKCKLVKNESDFSRLSVAPDGRQYQCKSCKSDSKKNLRLRDLSTALTKEKASRLRFHKNRPGRILELSKAYALTPEGRYARLKSAAKKHNRDLTISLTEYKNLIHPNQCRLCRGELSPSGYALDRVNNQQGYHLTNVVPCCGPCNRFRGPDLTIEEAKQLIASLKTIRGVEGCPWRNL